MPLNISKQEIISRARYVLQDPTAARYSDVELDTYLLIALNRLRFTPKDNPEWTFPPGQAGALIEAIVFQAENKREIPIQKLLNNIGDRLATACNNADNTAQKARHIARQAYKKGDRAKWNKYHAVARVWEINRDQFSRIYSDILPHTTHNDIPF